MRPVKNIKRSLLSKALAPFPISILPQRTTIVDNFIITLTILLITNINIIINRIPLLRDQFHSLTMPTTITMDVRPPTTNNVLLILTRRLLQRPQQIMEEYLLIKLPKRL